MLLFRVGLTSCWQATRPDDWLLVMRPAVAVSLSRLAAARLRRTNWGLRAGRRKRSLPSWRNVRFRSMHVRLRDRNGLTNRRAFAFCNDTKTCGRREIVASRESRLESGKAAVQQAPCSFRHHPLHRRTPTTHNPRNVQGRLRRGVEVLGDIS